jgi:pyruvate kinase
MINKKTKIVCTIGPASESADVLASLLESGMNIMRLNFSHGDFPEHQNRVDNLKIATAKTGITAETLQDLGGPKIRIGTFATDSITLVIGDTFTLTTDKIEGDQHKVFVNYPLLPVEVKAGDHIFLNDGIQKLVVTEVTGNDVVCKVLAGGYMKGKRGVNLPDSDLSVRSITEKDLADLEFGVANKVDYMALSFVRHADDITDLRKILNEKGSKAKIIAKIETPQAIKHIDEIIAVTDGIMVARGDLAVEVPFEKVPTLQKMMVKKCNAVGKFVIVATQMMESMVTNAVPTRAEVSDVANAVWDGADAVMLSAESANGKYPLETVQAMSKVIVEAEKITR